MWTGLTPGRLLALSAAVGVVNVALLYRRITSIATITVTLWVGTMIAVVAVIATGARHFDRARGVRLSTRTRSGSRWGFLLGLGAASRIAVYDYLGYYDVCYIGDEVKDPGRVIPRSIVISTAAVAVLYLAINLSIVGVVPWRDFVPADASPNAQFVVSVFMETNLRTHGRQRLHADDSLDGVRIGVCAAARLFAHSVRGRARRLLFRRRSAGCTRRGGFPHVSLLVLGALSIAQQLLCARRGHRRADRDANRRAVPRADRRRRAASTPRARAWSAAVPNLAVSRAGRRSPFVGWLFIFSTTGARVMAFGLGVLALGVLCFLAWSLRLRQWPFRGAES